MNEALCTPYMETLKPEKLLQLRAKTDRQLLDFIHSKLEAGLSFAAMADRASAQRLLNEVQLLLPVLNEKQRRDLDPKLNKLRETLERKTRTATSMW
jgi:hypothetical protein